MLDQETIDEPKYIDLCGYTTGVFKKTPEHCLFFFEDKDYGELIIEAKKDIILYYEAVKSKEYHLKAILKIAKRNGTKNKKPYCVNSITIKKVISCKEV